MPSSAVHTFTDPDEYATVFPATSADLTITGRGQFIANVTRIDLHRLWMLRFSDNLPRVKHSANITGRTIISFRTQPGPGLLWNGEEMHPSNIKQLGPGQSAFQQSAGLACRRCHVVAGGGHGFCRKGDCRRRSGRRHGIR